MATSITDFVNVRTRALELGLPTVAELSILPRGFENAPDVSGLIRESDSSTLRKLFAEAGLEVQELQPAKKLPSSVKKSADWIAPTLFVGSMLVTQNQVALQLALDVVSAYIVDFVKEKLPTGRVKFSVVVETSKSKKFKQLTYEGPPSGLKDLPPMLRGLQDE